MKINLIIGILVGIGVTLSAITVFLLVAFANSYDCIMEYPRTDGSYTEVLMGKKGKTVRLVEFHAKNNPQLPLFVSCFGQSLKLDASTTSDEVQKYLDGINAKYSVEHRQKFGNGGMTKNNCEFYFSAIRLFFDDGKTLSRIEIWNRHYYPDNDYFAEVKTSSGRWFVFPLTREHLEELLGKEYNFRKRVRK